MPPKKGEINKEPIALIGYPQSRQWKKIKAVRERVSYLCQKKSKLPIDELPYAVTY